MSTPDPFGDALAAQSQFVSDPFGSALRARAHGNLPDASKKTDDGEINSGPIGFINGIANIAGTSIANIPHAIGHAGVDIYRLWSGGDTNAPDPAFVQKLSVPLSETGKDVSQAFNTVLNTPIPGSAKKGPGMDLLRSQPAYQAAAETLSDVAPFVPVVTGARGLTLPRTPIEPLKSAPKSLPTPTTTPSTPLLTAPLKEPETITASGQPRSAFFEPDDPKVTPVDSEPVKGGLPDSMVKDRAQILARVGLQTARQSALNGDAMSAATDFQLKRFDEPAGQAAGAQFDHEKLTLQNFANQLIKDTGGTQGIDEDSLNNRGQTIAKPFDQLRSYVKDKTDAMYKAATDKLGSAPITTPNLESALNDRTLKNELLADGKSSFLDGVKDQLDNLKEQNGGNLTVQNAEQFRQFLNGRWSTAKYAVGKLKDALDSDVGGAVGEDVYAPAREMSQMSKQLLDDPDGVSQLFDVDPKKPLNRSTAFEKIPDTLTRLPAAQFDNVIRTLQTMPEEIQPQAQKALSEIKAHLLNKVAEAGNSTQGQWNAPSVSKVLRANSAKLQSAFEDSPETLAKLQDLDSAGKILKVDQSYPGAAAQAANALKRGFMSHAINKAAASIGAAAGSPFGGLGAAAGAAAGEHLGGKASQSLAEHSALKKWNAQTSDIAKILSPPNKP